MAKRNLTTQQSAGTKTVRVIEEHSYEKEVPIIDEPSVIVTEEPEQPDIFSAFNEIVTTNQNALLRIWLLPKYDIDGRASIHATDREYCGSVPYSSDNAVLLDQISGRVPQGGMVQLELFADGAIRKRGLLKLVKVNVAPNPAYAPQGTHLVINQPAAQTAQVTPTNPADMMREQMGLAKDLVAMAKDLAPAAPIVNVGEQPQASSNGDKPLEDRIFEALALKALESDKVPMDRLLEALSGRRSEPSIWESIAPIIGEVIKAFAPSINAMIQRQVVNAPLVNQPAGVIAPVQLGVPIEQEPATGEQQPPTVIDPIQRDWFQAMIRLLEDCTRHVELAGVGGGGKSVLPSAEAILELAERYPEQLGPTIQILLVASPIEVLDSCAMMLDERGKAHIETALKPFPSSVAWITELQAECKRIIEDAKEQVNEDENERAN